MDVTKIPNEPTSGYLYIQKSTQKLTVSITATASTAGLVSGPGGVLYRPGVVNPYGTPPTQGTSDVHDINWGGFDSPQATPQPTQVIDDNVSFLPPGHVTVITVLPADDSPIQQSSATESGSNSSVTKSQTVDTTA